MGSSSSLPRSCCQRLTQTSFCCNVKLETEENNQTNRIIEQVIPLQQGCLDSANFLDEIDPLLNEENPIGKTNPSQLRKNWSISAQYQEEQAKDSILEIQSIGQQPYTATFIEVKNDIKEDQQISVQPMRINSLMKSSLSPQRRRYKKNVETQEKQKAKPSDQQKSNKQSNNNSRIENISEFNFKDWSSPSPNSRQIQSSQHSNYSQISKQLSNLNQLAQLEFSPGRRQKIFKLKSCLQKQKSKTSSPRKRVRFLWDQSPEKISEKSPKKKHR